jgi:hypothetical protein
MTKTLRYTETYAQPGVRAWPVIDMQSIRFVVQMIERSPNHYRQQLMMTLAFVTLSIK